MKKNRKKTEEKITPTIGFEPFPGVHEAAHECVAKQHVSHWLWDDDIYHVWADHLLRLPLQDSDPFRETVTVHQDLQYWRRLTPLF